MKIIDLTSGLEFGEYYTSNIVFSQDNMSDVNFQIKNKRVIWQKIYEYGDVDKIISTLRSSGCDISINSDSTQITGKTISKSLPLKECGYSKNMSVMILSEPCIIVFTIDVKDTKYRITVNDIIWTASMSFGYGNVTGTKSLTEMSLKKSGKVTKFVNNSFHKIDKMLDYIFDIKRQEILSKAGSDDDW